MRDDKWVEKGLGDVKLLLNPETGKTRLVMRKERTLIFVANHHVSPDAELVPASSESDDRNRAFVYEVEDYSDAGGPKRETFALRFRSEVAASLFSTAYREAQIRNRAVDASAAMGPDATANAMASLPTAAEQTSARTSSEGAVAQHGVHEDLAAAFMSPVAPPASSASSSSSAAAGGAAPGKLLDASLRGGAWDVPERSAASDAEASAAALGGSLGGGAVGSGRGLKGALRWDVPASEDQQQPEGAESSGGGGVSVGSALLVVALGAALTAAIVWARMPASSASSSSVSTSAARGGGGGSGTAAATAVRTNGDVLLARAGDVLRKARSDIRALLAVDAGSGSTVVKASK